MRQQTETNHTLEIRDRPNLIFWPAIAGMYDPARRLADDGMLQQALDEACRLHVENYGQMHGVTFRVTSKIVTVTGYAWEDLA